MSDRDDAFALLARIPTLHDRGGAPLGWLGRRRLRRVIEAFRRLLVATPEDLWCRLGLGRALHAGGDFDGALAMLDGPGEMLPETHHEIALIALARGDAQKAEAHARAALEAAPEDVERLVDYALALLIAGQVKRALGVITNACKAAPEHPRTRPVLEYVRGVLDGKLPQPTRFAPGD